MTLCDQNTWKSCSAQDFNVRHKNMTRVTITGERSLTVRGAEDALVDEHMRPLPRGAWICFMDEETRTERWVICLRSELTPQPNPWPLNFNTSHRFPWKRKKPCNPGQWTSLKASGQLPRWNGNWERGQAPLQCFPDSYMSLFLLSALQSSPDSMTGWLILLPSFPFFRAACLLVIFSS